MSQIIMVEDDLVVAVLYGGCFQGHSGTPKQRTLCDGVLARR